VKSILEDGGPVQIKFDVDRKKNDVSLSLKVAGKDGSALAKNIAALGQVRGIAAALAGSDSVFGGQLNLSLPESVVKKLSPVVDEGFKQGLGKLPKEQQDVAAPLAKAFAATAKAGTIDLGFDLRGPHKNGKYTAVLAMGLKDGDKVESAFRTAFDKVPEAEKKGSKLDVAKAEGVAIHQAENKHADANAKEFLGEGPVYFAFRKDGVFVALGEDALATMKTVLGTTPKAGKPLSVEMSLAGMAPLMAREQKGAPDAAKKAFTEKDSDKVRLTLDTSKAFELKLSVKTAVLKFGSLMEKAQRGE